MTTTLEFHQLDVFTDKPLGGNPLAVFPQPGRIDDDTMQALARELNLSETTFITGRDDARQVYDVRIFTPCEEIPFAGHPTIGTAWLLFQELGLDVAQLTLNLSVGRVPVRIDRAQDPPFVYFTPPPIELEEEFSDLERLSALYSLEPSRFALHRAPAQFVAAGIRFLIVPVTDRAALEAAEADIPALRSLLKSHDCQLLTSFCLEGYSPNAVAATRLFAPLTGVPEDPATGSSASCLAHYLCHHGLIENCGEQWLKLDQGYSIGRPSALYLRANRKSDDEIAVHIGGQVVPVARGTFTI